jgi:hypothetical protein
VENLNNHGLLIQTNTPRLRAALDKARQARFEFGQTPSLPQKELSRKEPIPKHETQTLSPIPQSNSRTQICQSCGQEFKPYRNHFIYCSRCYQTKKKNGIVSHKVSIALPTDTESHSTTRPAPKPRSVAPVQPTRTRPQPKRKERLIALMFSVLIIGSLIIGSIWAVNYIVAGGMFGVLPTVAPTAQPIPATYTPRSTPTPIGSPIPITSTCACTTNTYNCADFSNQAEAQACYDRCFPTAGDIHFLDSDEDGKVCITLP